MRPPDAHGAAISLGSVRAPRRTPLRGRLPTVRIPKRSWLAILGAAASLAGSIAIAVHGIGAAAAPPASPAGTAFLGTATCADWRQASVERRATIVSSLGVAATQPDPESPGATLEGSATYGLFARACSTRPSRSSLLYEVYNRAASFRAVSGLRSSGSSALARP